MTVAAFAEVRLDDNLIVFRTEGGPQFCTNVVSVNNGAEFRNVNWEYMLGEWDLGERSLVPADFETWHKFFKARYGKAQGFRFKDWGDFKDKGDGVMLAIAGSATTVQMAKKYTSGSTTAYRKISKPIASTILIYRNAVLDSGATVDATTGIVTPTLMTGTLTWTGEFDTPVRFDVDKVVFEFIAAQGRLMGAANVENAFFHVKSLPITELRL